LYPEGHTLAIGYDLAPLRNDTLELSLDTSTHFPAFAYFWVCPQSSRSVSPANYPKRTVFVGVACLTTISSTTYGLVRYTLGFRRIVGTVIRVSSDAYSALRVTPGLGLMRYFKRYIKVLGLWVALMSNQDRALFTVGHIPLPMIPCPFGTCALLSRVSGVTSTSD
jgi:hypothetical protein